MRDNLARFNSAWINSDGSSLHGASSQSNVGETGFLHTYKNISEKRCRSLFANLFWRLSLLVVQRYRQCLQPLRSHEHLMNHGASNPCLFRSLIRAPAAVLVAEQTTLDAKTGESSQPTKSTARMDDGGGGYGRQKVSCR